MNTFLQLSATFAAWCFLGAMMLALVRMFRGPRAQAPLRPHAHLFKEHRAAVWQRSAHRA